MPLKVGFITCAHVHTGSYVSCFGRHPDSELVGIWDNDESRGRAYAEANDFPFVQNIEDLFAVVDAVVIVSENLHHGEHIEAALKANKHVLCEKPLVASAMEAARVEMLLANTRQTVMTAFPCRYAPGYLRFRERFRSGEIGKLLAVSATNRGTCPHLWFTNPAVSGGGAMIDHTVHVADLLRDLLGCDPIRVQAQIGSNVYGKDWDDTAMLTMEFPDGVFATLDASWSRPPSYKTWGDVTMTLVGEKGVLELDLFGSEVNHYHTGAVTHTVAGFGSDADYAMVNEFIEAVNAERIPITSAQDGIQAARIALAGYRSVNQPEPALL